MSMSVLKYVRAQRLVKQKNAMFRTYGGKKDGARKRVLRRVQCLSMSIL